MAWLLSKSLSIFEALEPPTPFAIPETLAPIVQAISESLMGIRLITTTKVSNTFHADLKKCRLFSSVRNRKDISNKKKSVINVSSTEVTEIAVFDSGKVFAPISSAEIIITHITLNSKNLLFLNLVKAALVF